MALDGTLLGQQVAQAMRDADLLKGETEEDLDAAQAQAEAVWEVVAGALIDHITANAVVSVDVSAGGLQTSTAAASPTGPPSVPVTLTGALS